MNSGEDDKKSGGWIAASFQLVVLGVVIGAILVGIYALKRGIWKGTLITQFEVILIVVITVIACFVCLLLDIRKKRRSNDPAVSRETPPPSEWADCCVAGYAKMGEFDRWVPEQRAIGSLPIQATQVLEDKTTNYHRVILLMVGALPSDMDVATLKATLDGWCKTLLRPNRFRGLGVGFLFWTDAGAEPNKEFLKGLVDYKNRHPAVIQWVVWASNSSKKAVGVHMHMEGRTTQCFVDLCVKLRESGFDVECCERPAEGILGFLFALNKKTPWWLHILGP